MGHPVLDAKANEFVYSPKFVLVFKHLAFISQRWRRRARRGHISRRRSAEGMRYMGERSTRTAAGTDIGTTAACGGEDEIRAMQRGLNGQ
jgi:hypothetical protein